MLADCFTAVFMFSSVGIDSIANSWHKFADPHISREMAAHNFLTNNNNLSPCDTHRGRCFCLA